MTKGQKNVENVLILAFLALFFLGIILFAKPTVIPGTGYQDGYAPTDNEGAWP